MTNWHTLVRHRCEQCLNTYPDKLSVKLCTHDNLEDKTMSQGRSSHSKATPPRAKRKPTTAAAKKRKTKTKKA